MQLNKSIKIFINYFLGPLLFAWLAFSIYRQIIRQPHLEDSWKLIRESFQSSSIIYLIVALLLIPVNWGLESWKWKLSVNTVYPINFFQAFKAVLSGVSFSVTMPNRVGEYLGRMLYLPEGNRLRTISVTLVGSLAQVLITIIIGTIGLIILKNKLLATFENFRIWYQFIVYGLITAGTVFGLIYFNISGAVDLFKRWISQERYTYLVEALQKFHHDLLMHLLLISFLRY
ncbi:MAG: lysylphosphatidylglycerol synthase domain-containing protein, partial [Flavisolibacter sp.]